LTIREQALRSGDEFGEPLAGNGQKHIIKSRSCYRFRLAKTTTRLRPNALCGFVKTLRAILRFNNILPLNLPSEHCETVLPKIENFLPRQSGKNFGGLQKAVSCGAEV